jgi:hypothetical protein
MLGFHALCALLLLNLQTVAVSEPDTGINVCFYLQVNSHPTAVATLVASVRKLYPFQRFSLVSDGGQDFSNLAAKHKLEYAYEPPICEPMERKVCPKSLCFKTPDEAHRFLTRIHKHTIACLEKWTVWLEADVKVIRKYAGTPPFRVNGFHDSNDGNALVPMRAYAANLTGIQPDTHDHFGWGVSGGSVFDTQALLQITSASLSMVDALASIERRALCSDVLFTALSWMNNFTVGPWDEICSDCPTVDCDTDTRDCATKHYHKKLYVVD